MARNPESNLFDTVRKKCPECALYRLETSTLRGIPDVYLVHQGFACWIELKVWSGNRILLRPEQINFMRNVFKATPCFVLAGRKDLDYITLLKITENRGFKILTEKEVTKGRKFSLLREDFSNSINIPKKQLTSKELVICLKDLL